MSDKYFFGYYKFPLDKDKRPRPLVWVEHNGVGIGGSFQVLQKHQISLQEAFDVSLDVLEKKYPRTVETCSEFPD